MNPLLLLALLISAAITLRLVAARSRPIPAGPDGLIDSRDLARAMYLQRHGPLPVPAPDCDRCMRLGNGKREATVQAGALNYCDRCWNSLGEPSTGVRTCIDCGAAVPAVDAIPSDFIHPCNERP